MSESGGGKLLDKVCESQGESQACVFMNAATIRITAIAVEHSGLFRAMFHGKNAIRDAALAINAR